MQSVNLLPHEELPDRALINSLNAVEVLLVVIISAMVLSLGWLKTTSSVLATANLKKKAQQNELKSSLDHAADLELKLSYIVDREKSWESLEEKNSHVGQLLGQIASATPPTVQINNLTNQGGELTIGGIATSRNDVSLFADNLDQVNTLGGTTIGQTTSQDNGVTFSLTVKLGKSSSPSPSPTGLASP